MQARLSRSRGRKTTTSN